MAKKRRSKQVDTAAKQPTAPADTTSQAWYQSRVRSMLTQALRELVVFLREHPTLPRMRAELFPNQAEDWSDRVEASAERGDAWEAVYCAMRLRGLVSELAGWDHVDAFKEKEKRVRGKEAQATKQKAAIARCAEEVRDRVDLLVNHKGMDVTEAQGLVAKERGISLRTIQRYCKSMRHG